MVAVHSVWFTTKFRSLKVGKHLKILKFYVELYLRLPEMSTWSCHIWQSTYGMSLKQPLGIQADTLGYLKCTADITSSRLMICTESVQFLQNKCPVPLGRFPQCPRPPDRTDQHGAAFAPALPCPGAAATAQMRLLAAPEFTLWSLFLDTWTCSVQPDVTQLSMHGDSGLLGIMIELKINMATTSPRVSGLMEGLAFTCPRKRAIAFHPLPHSQRDLLSSEKTLTLS